MRKYLVIALFVPVIASAQKNCEELRAELAAVPPITAVNRLAGASCLGGALDQDPYTRRVNRLFASAKNVPLSDEERRALTVAVLRAAHEYLGAVQAPEAATMRAAVQQAIRDRSAGVESPVQQMSYWTWDGPQAMPLGATGIDVRAMAQPGIEALVRAAHLAERAFAPDQARAIGAAQAQAAARDARWRSYFADARSQYPWELFVNSWRYEQTVRDKSGISGPPAWQWIVLHPDIGMQYVRSAAAGDRFKPALVLELVGYNRWSWGSGNRPQNAWGASLVRTYADTASVPSGAWGLAIHRNSKYTVTFTRLDGKTGVLLSIDLAGAVTRTSEEWSDRFRIGK